MSFEELQFANNNRLGNVEFIEEQISGRANYKNRQLGLLLNQMGQGDILIVPELSRIARSITQIFEVIEVTKQKGMRDLSDDWLWIIKKGGL